MFKSIAFHESFFFYHFYVLEKKYAPLSKIRVLTINTVEQIQV